MKAMDAARARRLIEDWQGPIYGYALRWLRHEPEARDATQEIFLKAIKDLPSLRSEDALRPWIFRVATRVLIDTKRARRRRREVEREAASAQASSALEEKSMEREERAQIIAGQVASLPERYRSVVVLKYYHGLTQHEVSEALELPRTTVASQLKRGLALLKERLAPAGALMAIPELEAFLSAEPLPAVPEALGAAIEGLSGAAPRTARRWLPLVVAGGLVALMLLASLRWRPQRPHSSSIRAPMAKPREPRPGKDLLALVSAPNRLTLGAKARVGYCIETVTKVGDHELRRSIAIVGETAEAWKVETSLINALPELEGYLLALTVRKSDGKVLAALAGKPGDALRAVEIVVTMGAPVAPPEGTETSLTLSTAVGGPHKARLVEADGRKSYTGLEGALEGVTLKYEAAQGSYELEKMPEAARIDIDGAQVAVSKLRLSSGVELWVTEDPVIAALNPAGAGRGLVLSAGKGFRVSVTRATSSSRPVLTWP